MSNTTRPETMPDVTLPCPVLLLEDDPAAQARIRSILRDIGYADSDTLAADSLAQARVVAKENAIAFAIVDMHVPDGSGTELIAELSAADPALPILVISAWGAAPALFSALQAGATGYLLKEREDIELLVSIRSVLNGGAPIDPFIAKHILALTLSDNAQTRAAPGYSLPPNLGITCRQLEILHGVARGLTNREIAAELGMSFHTVSGHVRNLYAKLTVTSRTQAVYEARALGILS